jgi:hypothetical protein
MKPRARRTSLGRWLRHAASILLTLWSAASCGILAGPAPPSLLGPGPDLPSADDGGVDVPPIFGTGGASASGGGPSTCSPEAARNQCVGDELWLMYPPGCGTGAFLVEVCSGACVTSPYGLGSCDGGFGGFGGLGGNGGAAP